MNTPTFTTVRTARTLIEADMLSAMLRQEGFHPLELGTAAHFSLAGADIEYPIRVPTAESVAAQEILKSCDSFA
ncbi:MAG TPA: hypothetical protein VGF13_05505 [Verrucomicrobiae bacterium]|jgi:hypothetical protein